MSDLRMRDQQTGCNCISIMSLNTTVTTANVYLQHLLPRTTFYLLVSASVLLPELELLGVFGTCKINSSGTVRKMCLRNTG